jgi:hypothetical protein
VTTRGDNDHHNDRGTSVKALLTDGPLRGKPVEVEPVEGRPPMTIDLPDEDDGTLRYCLSELNQSGATATYAFLYAV